MKIENQKTILQMVLATYLSRLSVMLIYGQNAQAKRRENEKTIHCTRHMLCVVAAIFCVFQFGSKPDGIHGTGYS